MNGQSQAEKGLLAGEDLGLLMPIGYPAEVTRIAAVVGAGKGADFVCEVLAHGCLKKPDELTCDDGCQAMRLDFSNPKHNRTRLLNRSLIRYGARQILRK